MDAKNIKEKPLERFTKFMIIQFVRIVFVGAFSVATCLLPVVFIELFILIMNFIGVETGISTLNVILSSYIMTFIFLYYHLIVKNRNVSKNGL